MSVRTATPLYVELIPVVSDWGHVYRVETGKTWKNRPAPARIAPGAIVVRVDIRIDDAVFAPIVVTNQVTT